MTALLVKESDFMAGSESFSIGNLQPEIRKLERQYDSIIIIKQNRMTVIKNRYGPVGETNNLFEYF